MDSARLYSTALAQTMTVNGVLTTIFTAQKKVHISRLFICNQGPSQATVRISVARKGAVDNANQYIYYDLPVGASDTFLSAMDIGLEIGDQVRMNATSSLMSVGLRGSEFDYRGE